MNYRRFSVLFPTTVDCWKLDDQANCFLLTKPLRFVDHSTNKTVKFRSLQEAWDFEFKPGKRVRDVFRHVENFDMVLTGGRGAGSGGGVFTFGSAGREGGNGYGPGHFPVEANVRIKTKTQQAALSLFSDKYRSADHEYAYSVDQSGYVHAFSEGTRGRVAIQGGKGQMIIHNHPSGGAFSKADMEVVSSQKAAGIIATGSKGDYTFRKTGHFKPDTFVHAMSRAKMRGSDYSDAVRKWLTANQKRFGYRFSFTPHK